eukprot:PhM_4_TR14235/c0_g1_i1/m.48818/K07299/SLC2A1, GLUT1; MFS transporter, SP family, solute carrier family 2 (facilitated glucose transporter), member 1
MPTPSLTFVCILVNVVGGSILGFCAVGINTALTVFYPCVLGLRGGGDDWALAALIASVSIGAMFGAVSGGNLSQRFGSKKATCISGLLTCVSIVNMFSTQYAVQFICRVIAGLGVGVSSTVCGGYVSKMAPTSRRGVLGSLYGVSVTFTIFLASALCYALMGSHRDLASSEYCLAQGEDAAATVMAKLRFLFVPCLISGGALAVLAVSPLMPETPDFMLSQQQCVVAVANSRSTCASRDDLVNAVPGGTTAEHHHIEAFEIEATPPITSTGATVSDLLKARRPFIISLVLTVALQFTGINAVMFYCATFLETAGVEQKILGTVIIMFWNFLSTVVAMALADRLGRRALLMTSLTFVTISMVALCPIAQYSTNGTLSFLVLALYIFAFEIGPGPLFWVVCNELFPDNVASLGFSIINMLQWLFVLIVTFTFGPLQKAMGAYVFWVFGVIGLFVTVFMYFCLPETQGKTRAVITAELSEPGWVIQKNNKTETKWSNMDEPQAI